MTGDRKLPDGWRWVRFGDVVRQVKDRVDPETVGIDRYVAGEHMDTDDLRLRRWGEVGDGYLGPAFHMRFKPGHVLYGSRRTYLRKVAVADFEGICANTTFVVEPATDELLPEFLPLVMTTEGFHSHSIKQSKGSVNPYINFRDIAWYEFPLPPIREQRAAVEDLSLVSDTMLGYERLQEAAELHRDALVASDWSADTPRLRLADVSDITVGIVVKPAALYVSANGVGALRSLNVLPGRLDESDLVRISVSGHASHQKSQLHGGDVVVVRSGSPGVAAVVPPDGVDRNAIDLLIVRCGDSLNPYFLASYLNSVEGRSQLAGRSGGTAQKHLNASQLAKVEIPLPTPNVQSALVELIELDSSLADAAVEARHRSDRLFSILREHRLVARVDGVRS